MTKTIVYARRYKLAETPIPPVKNRPYCAGCTKRRIPYIYYGGDTWSYTGYGYFCTLRCATDYANKTVKEKL